MSIKLNRKGAGLAGEDRVKENQNLEMIEQEFAGLESVKTDSAAAKLSALEALAKADAADSLSKNVQTQLNTIVVEGDSSPQAEQASVGARGEDYGGNLKARLDAEFNETAAQLAETSEEQLALMDDIYRAVAAQRIWKYTKVEAPEGFTWQNHYLKNRIFRNENGEFVVMLDISTLVPARSKTYHIKKTGSDLYGDGTRENPYLTLNKVLQLTDYDKIVFMDSGIYMRTEATNGRNINRPVTITADPGHRPKITTRENVTWSATSGRVNVFQASRSSVAQVVDEAFPTPEDAGTLYKRVLSVDEVESTPGSWFSDNSLLWLRPLDNRTPDAKLIVLLSTTNLTANADGVFFFENIDFEGGAPHLQLAGGRSIGGALYLAKNCTFKYGRSRNDLVSGINAVSVLAADAIFDSCTAAFAQDDGFNYHWLNGIVSRFIEINCIGRDNGHTGDNDNGSTQHDGGKGIRINGGYYRNAGPNVADVHAGTQTWNMGCVATESKSPSTGSQRSDFQVADSTAEMWLDECIGYNSENSLFVGPSAKAYVRSSKLRSETVNGTKVAYQ